MLPVEVVFLRMRHQRAAEDRIREKASELRAVDPRLLSCRVVVDVPHRHPRLGRRFHVRIELGIPDRDDIVVERGPAGRATPRDPDRLVKRKADEIDGAFTDPITVIQDAFDAAKRRLKTLRQRRRTTARARAVNGKTRVLRAMK